jgi:uncharacterized protein involved in exopolysaccharide biosynthesis
MDKETEFNFVGLFWIAWDQKYLVIAVSFAFGVIATIFALTATPMFRAQIVVTEVHDTGMGGGASGLMGQLGGLASIAGLNLNSNGPDAERMAVLESRGLVQEFVKRFNLAALINGKDIFSDPEWYAVERFRKNVIEVKEEKLKDTVVINVEWRDPTVAARWANDFVALANELLRERAILESTRNIEYLNKQLPQTSVVEVQHAIYGLIEAETKSLMLAHGRAEYAFTVVDPAVPPAFRFSPRRTLIVISGVLLGGFFGVFIAWARKSLRRPPSLATN